jgi:hypothetical protein
MAITALVLTPPLFFIGFLHLLGSAMATASGEEGYVNAYERVMPWVWSAGLGSMAVPIVLCALLSDDLDDGREVARRWLAAIQLVLLLAPTLLVQSLPFPD